MVTNFLIRKMYLLPLEGVRGEEPSLGEGLGGSYTGILNLNVVPSFTFVSMSILPL